MWWAECGCTGDLWDSAAILGHDAIVLIWSPDCVVAFSVAGQTAYDDVVKAERARAMFSRNGHEDYSWISELYTRFYTLLNSEHVEQKPLEDLCCIGSVLCCAQVL